MLKRFNVLAKPGVLHGAEVCGSETSSMIMMMVYWELGETPLDVDIKSRTLTFWARLCSRDKYKISDTIYSSELWLNQLLPCSIESFKHSIKRRLKDLLYTNGKKLYIIRRKIHSCIVSLKHRLALKIIYMNYQTY